ncbi:hypothetical protein, conserved [Babesia bigemina]|uniref:V-SNARE coiled-coil homology domain-containing protein n=1 Tax=Babesia bigemina TaxID=5866 RepID=A0A061DCJ7_BABBI|nr:hypothetical protein, conserved [Babesia bigemina]CDR97817.1 hypothetical protein, conserved [Babesia bigemina]|eukprot:XP_012770003.1 hypothetical protein, conserved [Babesia bigemina]
MAEENLLYTGLINLSTEHVLACYPRSAARGTGLIVEEGLEHVYEDATTKEPGTDLQEIQLENITIYYQTDDEDKLAVLVMVNAEDYPERLVQNMIQEIWRTVRLLVDQKGTVDFKSRTVQLPLSAQLARTFKRYNMEFETDKVLKAQAKVQGATEAVQESIQKIIDNCANMQQLKEMSQTLKTKAIVVKQYRCLFAERKRICVQYISFGVIIVIVVALYIALPIVLSESKK